LRIIGGMVKGRRLRTPVKGMAGDSSAQLVRPTADRAREALFNIISGEVAKAAVLDLFAGTGALGLEALSRGAESAVFIDKSPKAVELIRKNITLCGFADKATVYKMDLTRSLFCLADGQSNPLFSVVFADPPYRKKMSAAILKNLADSELLRRRALVVIEEESQADFPERVGDLICFDKRRYGDTGFWFYRFDPPKNIKGRLYGSEKRENGCLSRHI
jgi:16S rRNA (guanine966-N2)-methyltransferase